MQQRRSLARRPSWLNLFGSARGGSQRAATLRSAHMASEEILQANCMKTPASNYPRLSSNEAAAQVLFRGSGSGAHAWGLSKPA